MLVAYEFVGAGLVQNSNVGAGFKIQTWRPDPKFKHDCPRWGPDTVFQTVVYKNYILYYVYTYCIIYQKYYLQFLARNHIDGGESGVGDSRCLCSIQEIVNGRL